MLRDKQVASFTPTSLFTIRKLCGKIDFSKRITIVEYGPGTGVFTHYLLSKLTPDSTLIVIERNSYFVSILESCFHDPRLHIHHDSAENVGPVLQQAGLAQADYIISGIPFSFLPTALRQTIVEESYKRLRPGGTFLAYQTFFQIDKFLKKHLDNKFSSVDTTFCFRNAPPMRLFEAIK